MNSRFALALVLGFAVGGAAQAAAFQNGGFETGTDPGATFTQLNTPSTAITGWTVSAGSIDYISAGYWQPAEGMRSLDMSGIAAGSISQTFDTIPGHSYQVTFSLAGNPDGLPTVKNLTVVATGGATSSYTFDITGKTRAAMGWVSKTYAFTANAASTTLSFNSLDATSAGPALDNVVVTDTTPVVQTPTPVPTLSEWALAVLVLMMGVLGWRSQRSRAD